LLKASCFKIDVTIGLLFFRPSFFAGEFAAPNSRIKFKTRLVFITTVFSPASF
jgi:hypothetical protein